MYYYQVFGLKCASDIELPAFMSCTPGDTDFLVRGVQEVPDFESPPKFIKPLSSFNEREFRYHIEDVATYFVQDGSTIFICPQCEDWSSILLFFYSNAIAAMLYQRGLIPFHVSGVVDRDGVWLLSAPSRTGKSTTALKLQDRGYRVFTDDTALLFVENGACMAVPSYPMIRAWRGTLESQQSYSKESAFQIRAEVDKFGIHFHDHFQDAPQKVKGIIYLKEEGDEIGIKPLKPSEGMQHLGNNIYRRQLVIGMNLQQAQFKLLTAVAKTVPFWMAFRPKSKQTFSEFSEAIDHQIFSSHGK
jgi:hypothetical protein